MRNILAFDIETPNAANDRICSIGLTYIIDGEITESEHYLVNPETHFSAKNISIHGITPEDVANEPTFDVLWKNRLENSFCDVVLMAHSALATDLCVLRKTLEHYKIDVPNYQYICTLRIAEAFRGRAAGRNTLDNLCEEFGIEFLNHHNAEADSFACAEVYLHMLELYKINQVKYIKDFSPHTTSKCTPYTSSKPIKRPTQIDATIAAPRKNSAETQCLQMLQGILLGVISDGILNEQEIISLKGWLVDNMHLKGNYPFDRVFTAISQALEDGKIEKTELEEMFSLFNQLTNPNQAFCQSCEKINIVGKSICLTGEFKCSERTILSDKLTSLGADVCKGVTKTLNYLVVGSHGSENYANGTYGGKTKKAIEYKEQGLDIVIVTEDDFLKAIEV